MYLRYLTGNELLGKLRKMRMLAEDDDVWSKGSSGAQLVRWRELTLPTLRIGNLEGLPGRGRSRVCAQERRCHGAPFFEALCRLVWKAL